MSASYPTSIKSFASRSNGQTIDATHVNDLQDEVSAIETGLKNALQHNLIFTDATYDIGASGATRPRNLYTSADVVAGDQLFERGRTTAVGEWTAVAYADSNFTGDATDGNWTVGVGDHIFFSYAIVGKQLTVALTIQTSSVANTPAELRFPSPGGYLAAGSQGTAFWYSDNGTGGTGRCYINSGEGTIRLAKSAGTWTNSADLTIVQVVFTYAVA